jgi:hypothetical protein
MILDSAAHMVSHVDEPEGSALAEQDRERGQDSDTRHAVEITRLEMRAQPVPSASHIAQRIDGL